MQPCALFKNTENKASTLLRETSEKTEQRFFQEILILKKYIGGIRGSIQYTCDRNVGWHITTMLAATYFHWMPPNG